MSSKKLNNISVSSKHTVESKITPRSNKAAGSPKKPEIVIHDRHDVNQKVRNLNHYSFNFCICFGENIHLILIYSSNKKKFVLFDKTLLLNKISQKIAYASCVGYRIFIYNEK